MYSDLCFFSTDMLLNLTDKILTKQACSILFVQPSKTKIYVFYFFVDVSVCCFYFPKGLKEGEGDEVRIRSSYLKG